MQAYPILEYIIFIASYRYFYFILETMAKGTPIHKQWSFWLFLFCLVVMVCVHIVHFCTLLYTEHILLLLLMIFSTYLSDCCCCMHCAAEIFLSACSTSKTSFLRCKGNFRKCFQYIDLNNTQTMH